MNRRLALLTLGVWALFVVPAYAGEPPPTVGRYQEFGDARGS